MIQREWQRLLDSPTRSNENNKLKLLRAWEPLDIVFLIETKIKASRSSFLQRRLGFEGCVRVDPVGMSRWLIMMWRTKEVVELINYFHRHINVWCVEERLGARWILTGLYGNPKTSKRKVMGFIGLF